MELRPDDVIVQRTSLFNGKPFARLLYAQRLPDGLIAVAGEGAYDALERAQVLLRNFADQLLCGVADNAPNCLGLALCSGIDFTRRSPMLYTPVPKHCIRILLMLNTLIRPEKPTSMPPPTLETLAAGCYPNRFVTRELFSFSR